MSGPAPAGGSPARPHPALQQRRRSVVRDRGRRRRSWVLTALGVAAGLVALYWLATGPLLAVHQVDVRGYARGDSAELVRALEGAAGDGTVIVPATGRMRHAAEAFPWVESISVSRTWPRGLRVDVVEARPVAVVAFGGQAALVSESGRVLGPAGAGEKLGAVRLRAAVPEAGGTLPALERAALPLLATLPPALAARVDDLQVDRTGGVTASLAGGPPLRLGQAERMAAKAKALKLMLADIPARELAAARYIDLSVPENPALGVASGDTATAVQ